MKKVFLLSALIFIFSCKSKVEKTKPVIESISESVYASGTLKTKDQYEAFATVNGIVDSVYVLAGDTVKIGDPVLSLSDETQKLSRENADLAAAFASLDENQGKLREAKLQIDYSRDKVKNDSVLYFRQKILWSQQVGTETELKQRELNYQSSKTQLYSAIVKYNDLKRQLDFSQAQAKKNALISGRIEKDFTVKSEINGIVYDILKSKGEVVTPQTPLAIIGNAGIFILEMQVDEFDILKIKTGLRVIVTMDSYKGKAFEAKVTKINPIMNQKSKTFLVEAEFNNPPKILYPNISFEASILLSSKEKALLIPRNYLLNDSFVIKSNGDKVKVVTGLIDFKKVEILSGITAQDELKVPE